MKTYKIKRTNKSEYAKDKKFVDGKQHGKSTKKVSRNNIRQELKMYAYDY